MLLPEKILCISEYYLVSSNPNSWQGVLDTTLCDKVCQLHAAGMWFYPDTPISSKNKIDHHDITKIFVESSVKHHNPNPKILNFLQVMPYFSTQTYSTVVIPMTVLTEDGLLSWHITEQVTTLWKAWQLHFLDTQNL
jgi:hypothetical protein